MARVDVKPEILLWALQRTGKEGALKEKFPMVNKWIRRESKPTLKQLEHFAKATATPFGYFFLSKPPQERLPIPHFRTLGDRPATEPSPDLLETVQTMERRQAWLCDYLVELGQEPLPFVGSATLGDDPKIVARKMRDVLGLANGWAAKCSTWEAALRMLREKIEEAGIVVVVNGVVGNNSHRKLDVSEFRGFVLVDRYAPLIFVNGRDGKAAQMFTLAHELAHVWFGASAAFDLEELQPSQNETEQLCNKAAAEFLVPEEELRKVWAGIERKPDRFQRVARNFKVSELVGARRALDLSLITRKEFFEFYQEVRDRESQETDRDGGGGDYYRTLNSRIGRRFAEAVVRAAQEGRLSYTEAYRLTGLNSNTFSEFSRRMGLEMES